MWTYQESKPYAEKIGGRIVGSVKTKGKSENDLDILVHEYNQGIGDVLASMNFTYMGSQVVSPEDIRRSRKFGRKSEFWLRNHRFEHLIDRRRIEIWNIEKNAIKRDIVKESKMTYKFDEFKWLANISGFGTPVDVSYGTVYLGLIESAHDGYVIRMVDTPEGKKRIKQGGKNKFKTKQDAAETLHKTWAVLRGGATKDKDGEEWKT
jgi:hypothetical protein